jgi:hypothetical protein
MTLPPSIAAKVIDAAGKERARLFVEERRATQLLTLAEAARMLRVSKPSVRSLLGEWIDLGAQSPRVELRRVRELIESRKIPT